MRTLLLVLPVLLPLAAAAACGLAGWRTATAATGVAAAAGLLVDAVVLSARVASDGPVLGLAGYLRADALAGWLLLVIGAVATLACWASPGLLAPGRSTRWYGVLLQLFVAAMALAVLAGNLGLFWIAIEATTIVTAFLVGHHRSRTALEAAWKYVIICSAAIAIAFLGTVLLSYAAHHAGLTGVRALDWTALAANASRLDPAVARIAIGLIVLGFGAKAGLVPLHAWLPDAHSQAPAPVSALMSGVLLAVAFTAILRIKIVADAALGVAFLRTLLLILALATLAVAALLLAGQRDYKRMLAYSSMEHLGLMAVGAAIGTRLAIAAVLLHLAGHALAKTVAFLGSGHILRAHGGSSEVASVRGLGARSPLLAGVFGLAVLALLGFPPAAVFASELALARAGGAAGLGWVVAVAFALVLLAFVGLAVRTGAMLLGPTAARSGPTAARPDPATAGTAYRFGAVAAAPLVTGLVLLTALGTTSWPVHHLLTAAATIVGTR